MAKIEITHRALLQRLGRALAAKGQRLVGSRGREAGQRWSLVNDRGVVRDDVDLIELARELECLQPWERATS
jgi:hypothetical protein